MKHFISYDMASGDSITAYGTTLLNILNESVWNGIMKSSFPDCNPIKLSTSWKFNIRSSSDWITVAKKLYFNATRPQTEKVTVNVNNQTQVVITGSFDRIVDFPEGGTYSDITTKIQNILTQSGLTDRYLAYALLDRIHLNDYPGPLLPYQNFLDTLLMLLCCVEGSRHFLGLVYNLMLLDLIICGGDGKTKYTWSNVFVSGKGYKWDDSEAKGFGGKYPLAVNSTGAGNFSNFMKIIKKPNTQSTTESLTYTIQSDAVAVRGMTLIIHWLNMMPDAINDELEGTYEDYSPEVSFETNLKELFGARVARGYDVNIQSYTNIPEIDLKQNTHQPASPVGLVGLEEINDQYCVWLEHIANGNAVPNQVFFFHRAYVACKLIPEYILQNKEKKVKGEQNYTAKAGTETGKVSAAIKKNAQQCPCCYRTTKPTEKPDDPVIAFTYADSPHIHWYKGRCDVNDLTDRKIRHFRKAKEEGLKECEDCWPKTGEQEVTEGIAALTS